MFFLRNLRVLCWEYVVSSVPLIPAHVRKHLAVRADREIFLQSLPECIVPAVTALPGVSPAANRMGGMSLIQWCFSWALHLCSEWPLTPGATGCRWMEIEMYPVQSPSSTSTPQPLGRTIVLHDGTGGVFDWDMSK